MTTRDSTIPRFQSHCTRIKRKSNALQQFRSSRFNANHGLPFSERNTLPFELFFSLKFDSRKIDLGLNLSKMGFAQEEGADG